VRYFPTNYRVSARTPFPSFASNWNFSSTCRTGKTLFASPSYLSFHPPRAFSAVPALGVAETRRSFNASGRGRLSSLFYASFPLSIIYARVESFPGSAPCQVHAALRAALPLSLAPAPKKGTPHVERNLFPRTFSARLLPEKAVTFRQQAPHKVCARVFLPCGPLEFCCSAR